MTIFYLPDLGEGLAEAEINQWYIKVGDTVLVDQPLVSVETAKAIVDIPSPYTGQITQLFAKAGETVPTGNPLIEFKLEQDYLATSSPISTESVTVVGKIQESSELLDESNVIIGKDYQYQSVSTQSKGAMPAVRQLAKVFSIQLNKLSPQHSRNHINTDDVKQAILSEFNHTTMLEPLRGVRRTMAQTMVASHREVVPVSIFDEVNITDWRNNSDITCYLLEAIVFASQAEPALNVWYDGNSMERYIHQQINIGIAMDTPDGLFVPVIKNAAQYDPEELRKQVNHIKEQVKSRQISPERLRNATITLSNFGVFAGRFATPIVVPPMVAIVAVGKIYSDKVNQRWMPLSLTFDHRAVTGGEATRFLGLMIQNLLSKGK